MEWQIIVDKACRVKEKGGGEEEHEDLKKMRRAERHNWIKLKKI